MRKIILPLVAAISFGLPACALALGSPSVGINASTLGGGVTIAEPVINGTLNLAAQVNGVSLHHKFNLNGRNFRGDVHMRTAGVLLKWFPFHGMFNIDVGGYYNGSYVEAKPKGAAAQALVGRNARLRADFNKIEPYAGIALGNTVDDGHLTFTLRLGALYQGTPSVGVRGSGLTNAQRAKIEKDRSKLEDKLSDFKFFPVAGVGVAYKF